MKTRKLVPWYCRKCQSINPDICADECDECGEDFPSDWDDTKIAVIEMSNALLATKQPRLLELSSLIHGHMEAMRPLLDEWSKLK